MVKVDLLVDSRKPWVIIVFESSRIRLWVREIRRSFRIAASYGKRRRPFADFTANSCTFSIASTSRDRMRGNTYVACIADKNFAKEEKLAVDKSNEGSFQIKQHLLALLAALTTLSSTLSLVPRTMLRSVVVETCLIV